jgi:hypothetical protein
LRQMSDTHEGQRDLLTAQVAAGEAEIADLHRLRDSHRSRLPHCEARRGRGCHGPDRFSPAPRKPRPPAGRGPTCRLALRSRGVPRQTAGRRVA